MHEIRVQFKNEINAKKLSAEEFAGFFNIRYCSHLCFESPKALQKTVNDCPWILKSFIGADNREYAKKYSNELKNGTTAKVVIRWIDDQVGYGLFTVEDLPSNSYVGEYTGIVRRMSRLKPDYNRYCFHYPTRWWSWHYTLIDASKAGNEMRFLNHSDNPNLRPICAVDSNNLLHICFLTNRFIPKGTQLTFNYGPDYWKYDKKTENGRNGLNRRNGQSR